MSAESERVAGFGHLEDGLRQAGEWYQWGPYVSERQWGTVREDYSPDGEAWDYLPHDHARSRAYRWGEDGLAGFCDIEQRLCLALALWIGRDPILKERAFGLTGAQGNHGEDVNEYWWYLDAVPSHAWNRWRYHYPQAAYPYQDLISNNATRSRTDPRVRAAGHRRLRPRLLGGRGALRQGRPTLDQIAADLQDRLISLFVLGSDGRRPCFGGVSRLQDDPAWRDNLVFSEYFHGDNGAGLGASHQTGWTGLIADVIRRRHGMVPGTAELLAHIAAP